MLAKIINLYLKLLQAIIINKVANIKEKYKVNIYLQAKTRTNLKMVVQNYESNI